MMHSRRVWWRGRGRRRHLPALEGKFTRAPPTSYLTYFTRGIGVTGYNLLAMVNAHHDRFRRWGSAWDGDLSRSAIHPRGLYLARKLSSACGAQRGMGRGLVVWFRIGVPRP